MAAADRLRTAASRTACAIVAVCVVALVVRISVRDSLRATAPFFYATPPATLVAGGLCALTLAAAARARRTAVAASVVAAAGAALCAPMWRPAAGAAEPDPDDVRFTFWNAEHGVGGWDEIVRAARSDDPDVVCIVEGPGIRDESLGVWSAAFPGHEHVHCGGHLHAWVRGSARRVSTRRLDAARSRGSEIRATVRGREITILLCDVPSLPLLDRRPILDAARIWALAIDGPVVVAGDFNTPGDSSAFDSWRDAGLRDAWETAGAGWAPTWPVPARVLAIDHVWTSPGVTVRHCTHGSETCSDHVPVRVALSLR